MEGKGAEKPKTKPEADYSFDPIAASADAWGTYLLNAKNFEKDFARGEYPFKTPASTILEKVREAGTPHAAIETAVQAVLDRWDELADQQMFLLEINPIQFVASLADETSTDVVQKLWTDAPKDSPLLQRGLKYVAAGLGVNVPLDQEELEKLYTEQFNSYGSTPLEIMLERGEIERASALFETQIDKYAKGMDPIRLDYLVWRGLPASSAKKWLDQSVNAKNGYEGHYQEALERWGYKPEGDESAPAPRDIGQEFVSMSNDDFRDLLRSLRSERILALNADLSNVSDKNEFKAKARQVKAFVEIVPENQKRSASIKATRDQVAWEPNVFSSGVDLIEA